MTESELKLKLQKKFDHSTWKELLTSIFPKVEYLLHPTILTEKTDTAKSVRQIGNLAIADGNIGIFEVEVSSRKKIARNRVELRKIAASYIDQGIIHGDPLQGEFLDKLIVCGKKILSGECDAMPYKTFVDYAEVCHFEGASIAFNPDNLFATTSNPEE